MPNKRIVLLKAGGHVNQIPKASPALEPAKVHVEQDWAFGSADHGLAVALYAATGATISTFFKAIRIFLLIYASRHFIPNTISIDKS